MTDADEVDVVALKDLVEARRTEQARVSAQIDHSKAEVERALASLKEQFGVDSVQAAEALLERITTDLHDEVTKVRDALAESEE